MITYLIFIWLFAVFVTYIRARGGVFEPLDSFDWLIILLLPATIVIAIIGLIIGVILESLDNWWMGGRYV